MNKKFKTILVIVNFSNASYDALTYAVNMAKEVNGMIQLLYVSPTNSSTNSYNPFIINKQINAASNKIISKLESIVEIIETEGIGVTYKHVFGNIKIEVENYCDEFQPDLIIIGNEKLKGKSMLNRVLNRNSIATEIMDSVNIPTLVLKS